MRSRDDWHAEGCQARSTERWRSGTALAISAQLYMRKRPYRSHGAVRNHVLGVYV